MGYRQKQGQFIVMTAETDTIEIGRCNADCNRLEICRKERLRLYLDRFKDEFAPSLAHMWLGPFREAEKCGNHIVRLNIKGKAYRLFSMVHVSKLKQVKMFPYRPRICLMVYKIGRVDFDEELVPDDSWDGGREDDKFEVKRTEDVRSGRKPRVGRVHCSVVKFGKSPAIRHG